LKGHGCILGLTAQQGIYAVPRSCPDLAVTLLAPAGRRHGSLAVRPMSATGRTNRLVNYALGSFTDSDPEPHPLPGGYAAQVNWGDGMTYDATIVRGARVRGFEVEGTHFYCRGGARTITLTLSKAPASLFHVGEAVTLTYRVRFG
jgi:hypothetical protein